MGILQKIYKVCRAWDAKRFLRNIKFIIENDLIDLRPVTKDEALEDCVYELDGLREILISRTPKILNTLESLAILESQPKSFARFGDGEYEIMRGNSIAFQDYHPVLAEKMLKILNKKRDDLYVGLNRSYFCAVYPSWHDNKRILPYRRVSSQYRRFYMTESDLGNLYLDAGCLMGYLFSRGSYDEVALKKRKLFEGRKIAVVTGKSILDKLDYDIFELASSKIIIDAPSKNAFSAYDDILRDISRNVSRDTMIHLILGPTATAMAADLTDMGYLAWDSGHMAKDYDFYMKKVSKSSDTVKEFYDPD